jgi:hypothetical protein
MWLEFLVCWKRTLEGVAKKEEHPIPEILPENSNTMHDQLTTEIGMFPVVIILKHPVEIVYGLHTEDHEEHREWIVNEVETRGMTQRSASAALAAAWRGVSEVTPGWPKPDKISFKFNRPFLNISSFPAAEEGDKRDQERTLLRDVQLWINWDYWDTFRGAPISMEDRARILTD